jgi:hypothetical protein
MKQEATCSGLPRRAGSLHESSFASESFCFYVLMGKLFAGRCKVCLRTTRLTLISVWVWSTHDGASVVPNRLRCEHVRSTRVEVPAPAAQWPRGASWLTRSWSSHVTALPGTYTHCLCIPVELVTGENVCWVSFLVIVRLSSDQTPYSVGRRVPSCYQEYSTNLSSDCVL